MKKAVVLVSGGLDSATVLAAAKNDGFDCYALSFSYGQRHISELEAAKRVVESIGVVEHKIVSFDLTSIGGSALTDSKIDVPDSPTQGIPVTYVPARNTIFLSFALAWAEVLEAYDIYIGVNAVDYSGYPDCRPGFLDSFELTANQATRAGLEGKSFTIHPPLMDLNKAKIIELGTEFGVDYSLTVSCYKADEQGRACGQCDSCRFRKEGFATAGIPDPTLYY